MSKTTAFLTIAVLAVAVSLPAWIGRRRALRQYWDRACMGIRWRRRFPEAPKSELRDFLTLFVNAFGFDHKRRTYFSPDDRVMEVYRAVHLAGSLADHLELEALALSIEQRYGVHWDVIWREDVTLGELFGKVMAGRKEKPSGGGLL